jgi:hypothetical protein
MPKFCGNVATRENRGDTRQRQKYSTRHNSFRCSDLTTLYRELRSKRFEDVEAIPKGGIFTFANPPGGSAFNKEGL